MKLKQSKNAFTLIELTVVIAVIAILAAVLIPTFADILQKAQDIADSQLIQPMNDLITSYGKAAGRSLKEDEVKEILAEYGYDDIIQNDRENIYYWDGAEQVILAYNRTDQRFIYPREFDKKYSSLEALSSDCINLNDVFFNSAESLESGGDNTENIKDDENNANDETINVDIIEVSVDQAQNNEEALLNAIRNAGEGASFKFREAVTVNIDVEKFNDVLKNLQGNGRDITLDLNGSSIVGTAEYGITVPQNASLTFMNGTIDIKFADNQSFVMLVEPNAELALINVNIINSKGGGVALSCGSKKLVIDECEIKSKIFGVDVFGADEHGTPDSHGTISISNSMISGDAALCANFEVDVEISNSKLIGVSQGAVFRNGTVDIKNSVIRVEGNVEDVPISSDFLKLPSEEGCWQGGNYVPAAALVVGNYLKDDEAEVNIGVKLANVTLESLSPDEIPEMLLAARSTLMKVNVEYDSASTINSEYVIVYGTNCPTSDTVIIEHNGVITVNGKIAKLDDGKTVLE